MAAVLTTVKTAAVKVIGNEVVRKVGTYILEGGLIALGSNLVDMAFDAKRKGLKSKDTDEVMAFFEVSEVAA